MALLGYDLFLARKSLRRNPGLTLLVVVGIALGIAVSTTFAAVRHAFQKDPIPEKSSMLHYVRLDSWDPAAPHPDRVGVPPQVTYRDMVEIMKSKIPVRQSGMFKTNLYVFPADEAQNPFEEMARVCYRDFFAMFGAPFAYGGTWDEKADGGEPVVVLSEPMNQKLFGGVNSVGKTVRLRDRDFKVVGVLAKWMPNLRFYDLTQNYIGEPENLYIPFGLLRPMELQLAGNNDGWGPNTGTGFEGYLASESTWIQMWVELPNAQAVAAYKSFLDAYATEQKKIGRFQRPLNNKVTPLLEYMADREVTPRAVKSLFAVSLLFLAVCAVNLIGLLLGKFLARSGETSVRRALGASRKDVFLQHLVECQLVSAVGGVVGVLLALGALSGINAWLKSQTGRGDLFALDLPMLLVALALTAGAGLVSGLYPAWRACQLAPAVHLRIG